MWLDLHSTHKTFTFSTDEMANQCPGEPDWVPPPPLPVEPTMPSTADLDDLEISLLNRTYQRAPQEDLVEILINNPQQREDCTLCEHDR